MAIYYLQIISQNKETDQAKGLPNCRETGTCQQYQSSRSVDGDINTCTRTAPFGTTTSNPDKWTWWYVDLEKVLSIYSISIQFKDYGEQYVMRQRGRFAGFSLYVSNTTIKEDGYLCYKNGQELPTLDFTTTCVKHGRYVIFYNERLDGTTYPTGYETSRVYTELCEVTVTGCKESGVYGNNCDLPCPNNCQELRCDIVNGTCLGCTAGWMGEFCNESCPAGYYGLQCRSTCTGHCRDNLSCNHTTGQCDYGCGNGWTGIHCNTECPPGTYGPDCLNVCNVTNGCNPGYTKEICDKEAPNASNDEYSTTDAYSAVLSISVVINSVLIVVIVILLRVIYNRKQEQRSSDYSSSAEISPPSQIHNNDVHQYQELNMPNDSSYQNLSLSDRS
ncbi:multiple epidermal growth factor-like domains protein 10 [Ostrea edulis]|uniref:multiple epidermal growth factor-like domains protein 10 n=1 Tax=Ostrea edulis TaxID=37623 RepID=UPI0024AEFC3C|nr:multiple epidermal growth factor-like domains protein 10 [Ostrea edulis]